MYHLKTGGLVIMQENGKIKIIFNYQKLLCNLLSNLIKTAKFDSTVIIYILSTNTVNASIMH